MRWYLDYLAVGEELSALHNLVGYLSRQTPLTSGEGRQPYFHDLTEPEYSAGHHVFTGGIKTVADNLALRYRWLFLEDREERWYIQHPRPTFTHSERWIAPAVCIGDENSQAVVLVSVSPATHKKIVASVLLAQWGALYQHDFKESKIIERLSLNIKSTAGYKMPKKNTAILHSLSQQAFQWFQHHCHPRSGMVLDRAKNFGRNGTENSMSSIASTGYHLSLLPYAIEQGLITEQQASLIAIRAMQFALHELSHYYGLLY